MEMPVRTYAEEEESSKVLAEVGKEKITEADISSRMELMPPQFRARYETPQGKKGLLEQTIKFSLLSQQARALGIDKREDVAKKIKDISDNIIIQELTKQEITDKITVSDKDIEQYYQENTKEFLKPEKVKAYLILFEVKEDTSPEEKKAKEKKAQETLARLKKGEDFEKLARELSEDKRSKKRGGTTGFFARGRRKNTYGEIFEEKAFSMKPGELSDVFEDKKGYYIIKVAEKKEEKQQTLEDVKKRIERRLKQQKQKDAYDNYLAELEKKFPVKIMEESPEESPKKTD
jgi:peptidyl-prolyl cis-trans isomerase C